MIKCGLCGTEFEDHQYDEYASHVRRCAYNAKLKAEREKKKLEEINSELNIIKKLEAEYKQKKDACDKRKREFKEKYPDEYEMNFKDEQSKLNSTSAKKTKTEVCSDNDNLDEKEIVATILNDIIASLFMPDTHYKS